MPNRKFTLDELKTLNEIDRVELSVHKDGKIIYQKTIDDPEQINSIVTVFRGYAENWQDYGYGPEAPPAPLIVDFYDENKLKAGVGIGYSNQNKVISTPFYLKKLFGPGRSLEEQEFQELLDVLDVDQDLTYQD